MGKTIKTSLALEPEQVEWIDRKIKDYKFSSRSHAVKVALKNLMEADP